MNLTGDTNGCWENNHLVVREIELFGKINCLRIWIDLGTEISNSEEFLA